MIFYTFKKIFKTNFIYLKYHKSLNAKIKQKLERIIKYRYHWNK